MKKLRSDSPSDRVLIVAAEASSCMYAKRFMSTWRKKHPQVEFFGVGDQEMENLGLRRQGHAETMAVVGLQEVMSHWTEIKACFHDIIAEVDKAPPRFAILLDYPGFNLRLAKRLKALGVPVVYYISPQLWAWKKGRVTQVRDYVDDMMVVFPFEVDFYQQYGIEAHFVGHPLVEVIEEESRVALPAKTSESPVLGLMPGSRWSEIKSNFQNQVDAAVLVAAQSNVHIRVLVAPTLDVHRLKSMVDLSQLPSIEFISDKPTPMIRSCDYILSASGTATLQVALCLRPMVVMYRMNPITAFLAKRLVKSVDAFCIVNLIAGSKIVPELFQEQASPESLAKEILQLIHEPTKKDKMLDDLRRVKEKLGGGGATVQLVNFLWEKYGL